MLLCDCTESCLLEKRLDQTQGLLETKTNEITKLQAEIKKYELSLKNCEERESDLQKLVSAGDSDLKEQQKKFDEVGNPDFDNVINLERCMKNQLQLQRNR